jgi:hypothetical protein
MRAAITATAGDDQVLDFGAAGEGERAAIGEDVRDEVGGVLAVSRDGPARGLHLRLGRQRPDAHQKDGRKEAGKAERVEEWKSGRLEVAESD